MPLDVLNNWVGLGSLILQVGALALLVLYFMRQRFPDAAAIVGRWGLLAGLVLSLAGTLLSLYYSEVLGILPCGLCWLQRIFLYPQVVLFAVAIWKKERAISDYSISLSVIGGAIALYQHYLQMGGEGILPCPAVTTAADCARRYIFEFGYITFPFLAFVLFVVLIVLMTFVRKRA